MRSLFSATRVLGTHKCRTSSDQGWRFINCQASKPRATLGRGVMIIDSKPGRKKGAEVGGEGEWEQLRARGPCGVTLLAQRLDGASREDGAQGARH